MIDSTRITNMASLFQDSAILFAASDLGIFEALARLGTAPSAAVASELSLNPRAAGLMLDACVAIGLLEKHGDCYRNTPESAALLVPGWRPFESPALHAGCLPGMGAPGDVCEIGRAGRIPAIASRRR